MMREFPTYILRTSLTSYRNKENIMVDWKGSKNLRVSVLSVLDSSGYIKWQLAGVKHYSNLEVQNGCPQLYYFTAP
jgi:hypothetical protein